MHDPIAAILDKQPLMILDGALASELERRGADLADPLWSAKLLIESPDAIRRLHADYYAAGADVAITASYQASFQGFAARGLDRYEAVRLMRLSVGLAREARDGFWAVEANRAGRVKPLVAASVGPYGAVLADGSEYRGDYGLTVSQLMDFHRPRLDALLSAGPELLACETLPSMLEAEALARVLSDDFTDARAWVSFTCRDGAHTADGGVFADAVALLSGVEQVVAVGVNCTAPAYVAELISRASVVSTKPLLAYPNSGERYDAEHKCWHGRADDFAALAHDWFAAGARLIGGCCRTGPADIRALSVWRRELAAAGTGRG
ncbi:homocysteine S-methyltransferase [Crenobacter cavernae]|uniref:S-methylmethionine:homocysteine methyltransferase n=1 Tax=Crenobacter cavernae TaxID=2290923 RepID=A0A345Y7H8_9NEIS|nr:homocysteine S-methyltransferase [Crenobacter cavernae]AXK39880.1 homocysteine S-methyltransferase [Crenobacter cavernae]